MKWTIISILLAVALVGAEPPRRRFRPFLVAPPQRFQRIEEAPYPPSGWKPEKPFYLPGEDPEATDAPTTPSSEPEETTTAAAAEETTTAAPTDEDQQGDSSNVPQDARQLQQAPVYVIIPEKTVALPSQYQVLPAQYQVVQDPYTGSYVFQDVTHLPFGYSQRLVQILKK